MSSPLRLLAIAGLAITGAASTPRAPVPRDITSVRAPLGAVLSLSILPAPAGTDVVIGVNGEVTVQDFTLTAPHRIVVDLTGATLSLPVGSAYDRVGRGSVTDVRYAQFKTNIVRVVLTIDAPHGYKVARKDGEVRVTVDGAAKPFAVWKVGSSASLAKVTVPEDARLVVSSPEPVSALQSMLDEAAAARKATPLPSPLDLSLTPLPPPLDLPPAPPAPPAPKASGPVVAPARPAVSMSTNFAAITVQQSQQPPITITFDAQPMVEVIRTFIGFSGRNIIFGPKIVGTVNQEIRALPWDVALRSILNSHGFDAYTNADGVIVIDTFDAIAQRAATQPLGRRRVQLNYAKSYNVAPMVEKQLTRENCNKTGQTQQPTTGAEPPPVTPTTPSSINTVTNTTCPKRGLVDFDSLTNSIYITDLPSALDELEAYARSLDLRPAQVNISAKIILVDRTSLEGLGLRYDLGSRNQFFNGVIPRFDSLGTAIAGEGVISLGGNMLSAIANATQRVPAATVQLVYSTAMGGFDFSTFLEALQQTSLLDVEGTPSLTTLNGRLAELMSGTDVPQRTIDLGSASAGGGTPPQAVTSTKTTGIVLRVTPQVTNNRQVSMKVYIENSDVTFIGTDAIAFPKQAITNEIIVADGETAVIGGLIQTTVRQTRTGIPLLVDLPIIGKLFGVTQRQETKRDLLLLITPHIMDAGETVVRPPGSDLDRR